MPRLAREVRDSSKVANIARVYERQGQNNQYIFKKYITYTYERERERELGREREKIGSSSFGGCRVQTLVG